jgi:ketosteroid isomerase-like protein
MNKIAPLDAKSRNKLILKPKSIRMMKTEAIQSKEEVAREIAKIYEEMAKRTLNWDDEKAASLWTEDGINLPAYGLTQNRKELIVFCRDIALNNRWEILDYKPLELFVHGDMAYEFSLFEHNTTPHGGGGTVNTKMRCISVYKKENGRWKLHRWMPQYFTGE